MQVLVCDLRYGTRSLRHRPGLTIVAILALTLGIGLTTMMASIVYGALLKGVMHPGCGAPESDIWVADLTKP
ncbi:MAG: hypothetical protein ACREOQ_12460 [Gemmatimonadales bacterium]